METTVARSYAENTEGLTILDDEPATDRYGRTLPESRKGGRPVKDQTTVDEAAAAKKTTAKSAASKSQEA
jgi:hypothetical protein